MNLYVCDSLYYYYNWTIKFKRTYNSKISFNYLVLDAFLPKAPTEVTAFITRMCSIIQEKKCISLAYEPDKKKRCLQWVLEAIDFTQNVVSNRFYDFII